MGEVMGGGMEKIFFLFDQKSSFFSLSVIMI